ncbi:response regulator transcription factor [Novosphingobium flavum]|uniref:Response regulator transcription factor n=1 Tax=Novosphingobium flavum TaxID=1778672 RepID=A0A7X1FR91_9SPHN|nr:response regulator transcription factor [Novosphingobium flavum]MBC2665510.1 response regulator transcription factor [Novosphingobium flavum]
MRILLVDDHPMFREALAATVEGLDALAVVEQFDTLQQLYDGLGEGGAGTLVLLDLQLADATGMVGLIGLKARYTELAVAIVSGRDDEHAVATALACGAAGYIPKSASPATLSAALRTLLGGHDWFPPGSQDKDDSERLSPIQMRILDGVKRGKMNKQIAWEVGLSEHSIKYHLTGIFRKLGCQTRAQLLAVVAEVPTAD